MPRLLLTDEFWSKLEKILLDEQIYRKQNLRLMVEGMLYRLRVGCPWRDLPEVFGDWNTVYKRFNAWSISGKWLRIFKALVNQPDLEWTFIDGSYIKAHQHSAGAASEQDEAIGKSRAGHTTKIHLAVDAFGKPIEFSITGGQVHDCVAASEVLDKLPKMETVIADKGYDSEKLREQLVQKASKIVIPRRRNSIKGNEHLDRGLYRYRHLIENAFARLKQFRALATRFDKLKRNYESMVAIACAFLWLPM